MINGTLYDDCDGFHAAMYWALDRNQIPCRLFNVITSDIKSSHTVLIFRWEDDLRCLNYDVLSEAIKDEDSLMNFIRTTSYGNTPTKIIYTCVSRWMGKYWASDTEFVKLRKEEF
jgi:hypothetical protein